MRVISLGCTKIWPHPHSLWCWGWVPISLPSQDILGGYWQVRGLPHHYAPRPRPRLPREFTCKYEISLCKTRDSSGMRNRAGDKPNLGTIQDFILCKPATISSSGALHALFFIEIFYKEKNIILILVSKASPEWSSKTKIWLQLALATLLLSLMLALDGGLVRPRGGPHSSPSGSAKHQDRETSKYVLKTGKCFKRFVVHSINNDRVQKV